MTLKRLIVYLALNAIVSATITLSVLWIWDRTHPGLAVLTPRGTAVADATAAPLPATLAPTLMPTPTPTLYVVLPGDTLGVIAERYNLAVEDLMAANGLSNPDALNVGQTLIIPVAGVPAVATATAAAPTLGVPLVTATPNVNAPAPRLVIREVLGAGALSDETIVIVNLGGAVDLAGWSIRDAAGRQYTFPALRLFENGAVNLHTAAGADTVTDLYWNQTQAIWSSGQEIQLTDTSGTLHARFTVP